jgi:dihydroneopterin aldolase
MNGQASASEGDRIHIEQLEVSVRVGVTEEERAKWQRLTLNLTLWPQGPFHTLSDEIGRTVDYAAVCTSTRSFMNTNSFSLIETFAEQLASHLLGAFSIRQVAIEVRKFAVTDALYTAVILKRGRGDA